MPIINGKKFDTSFVCARFNNNNDLLLEEIAEEFGISRDELVDRLKRGASRDEKDRVKGVIRQDEKRQKRRYNNAKQQNELEAAQEGDTTMEEVKTPLEAERIKLKEQIAQYEQKLHERIQRVDKLEAIADESKQSVSILTAQLNQLESQIEVIEKRLEKARANVKDVTDMLKEKSQKYDKDLLALEEEKKEVRKNEEKLELLSFELEELENHTIYLVSPSYDVTKLPNVDGRIISSVELDGVEPEKVQTDMDQLSFGDMVHLSQITGFGEILELGTAYEFAWLAANYMGNPSYEVYLLNDDERIKKLIDWMMS